MNFDWAVQIINYIRDWDFIRFALIIAILVSICASLLGVTLVLKRFSFIGHGLSNVAFGTIAVATAMNFTNNTFLVLPVTILTAILLLRTGSNTKIKGDAAIAMVSVGALAIGYLVMNIFPPTSNLSADVCSTLFGSIRIVTISRQDVIISIILSIVVVTVFLLFYNKIFSVTFDEDFASATGIRAKAYNLILASIIAIVIVMAVNLVGTLLITALVIFPAMSAMRLFKSFRSVTVCSVIVSVTCAVIGICIALLADTHVGSTIVAVNIAGFILFYAAGLVTRKAG